MLTALAVVASLVSTVAVVASVLLLWRQLRDHAAQSRATDLRHSMSAINSVVSMIAEYPELYPFFYLGEVVSVDEPLLRGRVEAVAELMADAMETAIDASSRLAPSISNDEDVESYALHILDRSPCTDAIVAAHPEWWPRLGAIRESRKGPRGRMTSAPLPSTRVGN